MSEYVVDIETNNLLGFVTKVHCIAAYNLRTHEKELAVTPREQEILLAKLSGATLIVGHNWSQYDEPVLGSVYGWKPNCPTYDTLLAGCILWPEDIRSLETWAKILKLKQEKVQNEDWSIYTDHMGQRCLGDIEINARVYEYIKKQPHEQLLTAARLLEQGVARVHAGQIVHGVRFNIAYGEELYEDLDEKVKDLRGQVIEQSPAKCLIVGVALKNQEGTKKERTSSVSAGRIPSCTASRTATGEYTAVTKRYFPKAEDLEKVLGPYTKVEFRRINPDSPQEVKALLLDLGWIPTEYNVVKEKDGSWRTTTPKLTEDSYDTLPDGYGKVVATYNTLKHRRNFLMNVTDNEKGAIPEAIRGKGYVQAHAFTCGTPTARYRHNGVVCNIPRVTSIYGKEMRRLFCVSVGAFQVGVDLSGIEARMLAHYLLRGNYTRARETADLILSPDKGNDFHSYNAKIWGVSRDDAKTCLYALMYGAGAKKLARILGRKENQGAAIKKEFYKAHPAIKELNDDLVRTYRTRKYLLGLDGRPLYCRGENKLLNQLLQNAAAIVFKRWMIVCDDNKEQFQKLTHGHASQIIAYHDELQFELECTEENAKLWGATVCEAALQVGEEFKLLVPIEAAYKIGKNWAECH